MVHLITCVIWLKENKIYVFILQPSTPLVEGFFIALPPVKINLAHAAVDSKQAALTLILVFCWIFR